MASHVIQTDSHVWVAGISWLTFATRPPTKDLLAMAKESHSGYVATRNAGAFQVGFSQLDKLPKATGKTKKPVLCLGPAVSMSHAAPWRGIFDLGGGQFWYVAVRDNFAITIDGDVVGERALIDSIADSHAFYDDWTEVTGTLEDLLQYATMHDAPQVTLSSTKGGPAQKLAIGAGVALVVAAVAFGGFKSYEHWRMKRAMQEAALAQAKAKALLKTQRAQKDRALTIPIIDPQYMLRVCAQKMEGIPTAYEGWSLESVACHPSQLTITWKKEDGANDGFVKPGQFFDEKTGLLRSFYNIQNVKSDSLKKDPGRAKQAFDTLHKRLEEASFNVEDTIRFPQDSTNTAAKQKAEASGQSPQHPPKPTVLPNTGNAPSTLGPSSAKGKAPSVRTVPLKSEYDFTVTGQVSPFVADSLFKGIKGLTLESVEWTSKDGWWYTGRVQ